MKKLQSLKKAIRMIEMIEKITDWMVPVQALILITTYTVILVRVVRFEIIDEMWILCMKEMILFMVHMILFGIVKYVVCNMIAKKNSIEILMMLRGEYKEESKGV